MGGIIFVIVRVRTRPSRPTMHPHACIINNGGEGSGGTDGGSGAADGAGCVGGAAMSVMKLANHFLAF